MASLIYLIPIALFLGLLGLAGFLWAMRSGQYEDLDGAAERILFDEEDDAQAGRLGWPRRPHVARTQEPSVSPPPSFQPGSCRKDGAHGHRSRPRAVPAQGPPPQEPGDEHGARAVLRRGWQAASCATGSTTRRRPRAGLALTMFGGSTTTAPDSPSAFGQINAVDRRDHPVVPAAGRRSAPARLRADVPDHAHGSPHLRRRRRLAADPGAQPGARAAAPVVSQDDRAARDQARARRATPPGRGAARKAGWTGSR